MSQKAMSYSSPSEIAQGNCNGNNHDEEILEEVTDKKSEMLIKSE